MALTPLFHVALASLSSTSPSSFPLGVAVELFSAVELPVLLLLALPDVLLLLVDWFL